MLYVCVLMRVNITHTCPKGTIPLSTTHPDISTGCLDTFEGLKPDAQTMQIHTETRRHTLHMHTHTHTHTHTHILSLSHTQFFNESYTHRLNSNCEWRTTMLHKFREKCSAIPQRLYFSTLLSL